MEHRDRNPPSKGLFVPERLRHSFVWLLLAAGLCSADPVTVVWSLDSTQGRDSWISEKFPDTPYGSADSLVVGIKGKYRRSLIGFDTPAVLPGTVLLSAELSLYVRDFKGAAGDSIVLLAHRLASEWVEGSSDTGGVTWNEREKGKLWNLAGG